MTKKAKVLILITFFSAFLLLISLSGSNYTPFRFTTQINGLNDFNTLSFENKNYTGAYEGNISLMYTWWDYDYSIWADENQSSNYISPDIEVNNYTYLLDYIDIYAYDLFNGSDSNIIADNLTAQTNMTESIGFAQEFVASDLITVENISIFLNYSLSSNETYRFEVSIYDETFQRRFGYNETWYDNQDYTGWFLFQFYKNILRPGEKYNIALSIWFDSDSDYRLIDFWKAETHNESSDKGITRSYDGYNWNQIQNDTTLDFFCVVDYRIIIDPAKIDLKFIIDDQIITPLYRQSVYSVGYEAFFTYNLESPPEDYINVTVVSNQTLETLLVELLPRYAYLIEINGTYTTSENQIEWVIEYLYKDVSGTQGQAWDFFLYERDWNLIHFYDPSYNEFEDLFIGPIKLWNVTYNGICNIYVMAFEQDTHTGIYHSPNYCAGINTQIKINNTYYQDAASFKVGQEIRIEAEIKDSSNKLISGGTGLIELISPSGIAIYNETALTSFNGILNSSDINLGSALEEGIYTVNIFWTNGREIAFSSTIIEIKRDLIPLFPQSNALPTIILVLIGGLIAAAIATPAGFLIRRQLQQRNWEKSCRNLFVFAKSGVSMYFHTFGIEIQDPTLISAMITALTSFIQEATGSKKLLRTVDQEDKKILIFHGDYSIHALIAEKNLPIIRKNLEGFGKEFEKTFASKITKWDGNTAIFKGTEKIIDKFFPVEMEEKIIRGVRQKLTEFMERIASITDPVDIISIFREITEFTTRYQAIITKHYSKEYNELIKIAEEKLHN